jgi:putative transposase
VGNNIRYYLPGAYIFVTVATKNRSPIFRDIENQNLLKDTIASAKKLIDFEIFSHVLLPDHFHWIISVSSPGENFSNVVKCVKGNFTANYKKINHISEKINLWQPGFWDHVIRDERDLKNHMDYIHWNPVKHGYTDSPFRWMNSSINFFYSKGNYPEDWLYKNDGDKVDYGE